jgi:hypothetical protein
MDVDEFIESYVSFDSACFKRIKDNDACASPIRTTNAFCKGRRARWAADRPRTGDVMGMLKIEKMGFFELHFSNVQTSRPLRQDCRLRLNARCFQIGASEGADAKTSLLSSSTMSYRLSAATAKRLELICPYCFCA